MAVFFALMNAEQKTLCLPIYKMSTNIKEPEIDLTKEIKNLYSKNYRY